jgi:hypothetical protein
MNAWSRRPFLRPEDIRVAVLDGPVDLAHPCFAGARLTIAVTFAGVDPAMPSGHGTHVASLLFGQPGSPVEGLAPNCTGILVPIYRDRADGALAPCLQLDLARAIVVALEAGAHVINISGGQWQADAEPEPVLARALASCADRNVLIVAAAGNDGCECLHVPAAVQTVLSVGALDDDGRPLASSNWAACYRANGLVAPGAGILGAAPGGGTVRRSGTSFATALVSGAAANLLCAQIARGEAPDPMAVKAALLAAADACDAAADCPRFLGGRLNTPRASDLLARGVDPMNVETGGCDAGIAPAGVASVAAGIIAGRTSIGGLEPPPSQARGITPSCGGEGCTCGGHPKEDCGCGCKGASAAPSNMGGLVYALGSIGYDFQSESRRDYFVQAMPDNANNPLLPDQLLAYLDANPYEAQGLVWTLNVDATPIYAIQPAGPFAAETYARLREVLRSQIGQEVQLVSIPGVIIGSVRLLSGQAVPAIAPALRGVFDWSVDALVTHALGPRPVGDDDGAPGDSSPYDRNAAGLTDFLNRIYFDLRNLGLAGSDRALNFAATDAAQASTVIEAVTRQQLDLDTIVVSRSGICRPGSDCYDVELSFFNPDNMNVATRAFRSPST